MCPHFGSKQREGAFCWRYILPRTIFDTAEPHC
jgi:hypothetical protein